jgi:HrpA-like RNA helicase
MLLQANSLHVSAHQASQVSPKCDDKVDLDQISDLISQIIDSEARSSSSSSSSNRKQSNSSATSSSAASGEQLGAILVFLPGAFEINRLVSMLRQVRMPSIMHAYLKNSA